MPDDQGNETSDEKLARYERENGELKAQNDAYDRSLKALADREPRREEPPVAQPSAPGLDAYRQQWRSRGYTDEQIDSNLRVMQDFLPAVAQPVVQALGTVADQTDYVRWRTGDRYFRDLDDDEAEKFDDEVKGERRRANASGLVKSYEDAAAVVKSRRAPSKKSIDDEVERRVQERLRAAGIAGVTDRGSSASTQTAGPGGASGNAGSRRVLSADEFDALTLDKKRAYLDEIGASA